MHNLELFIKMIESMDGLDVSVKIGKESEIVIKGDFKKMITAVTTLMKKESDDSDVRRKIRELEEEISK